MCGIFAVYKKTGFTFNAKELINKYIDNAKLMEHRGEQNTYRLINNKLFLFHNRLSTNDLTNNGRQPMIKNNIMVILNGKIENYKELYDIVQDNLKTYLFKSKSHSEILIPLYIIFGSAFIAHIKGMFSFVLYDSIKDIFIVSRDHIGLTSLYYTIDGNNGENIIVASEMKSLSPISKNIKIFEPGQTYINNTFFKNYNPTWKSLDHISMEELDYNKIKDILINSVIKCFKTINSDQTVGIIMSKDLESYIFLSIIAHLKKENIILNPIKVFTIELDNINPLENVDIIKILSKLYDIPYYSYTYELDDIEDVLEDVIYYLETYNAETIRRSIPLYLLSMQIKEEDNNIKTIMSADLLDTLFFSAQYKDSESRINLQKNIIDRLINIHKVDLCSSHNIAISNLLEFHVPFGSKDLIDYIMNIDPKYKLIYSGDSEKNIEKYILRKAFDGFLSKDMLWGIYNNDSFKKEVTEYFNNKILDINFENEYDLYPIDMPKTKEEYIYRKIYESMQ